MKKKLYVELFGIGNIASLSDGLSVSLENKICVLCNAMFLEYCLKHPQNSEFL